MEAKVRQATLRTVDYTPSGAAVAAGQVVLVGDQPMIAAVPIADGVKGALDALGGVYRAVAGEAIAIGKKVYWDNSANKLVETATGNKLIGISLEAAAADGDLIDFLHVPDLSASTPAANVAALGSTTNLTAIAGSYADLAAARTSVNTLATEVEARLDAIETKVDAVIAALKTAGLMATS